MSRLDIDADDMCGGGRQGYHHESNNEPEEDEMNEDEFNELTRHLVPEDRAYLHRFLRERPAMVWPNAWVWWVSVGLWALILWGLW
jgi:hypothetical protein